MQIAQVLAGAYTLGGRYAKALPWARKTRDSQQRPVLLWMVRLSKISMAVWRHKF